MCHSSMHMSKNPPISNTFEILVFKLIEVSEGALEVPA